MSDRLSLAGIREEAMNPPAGGARGAEDYLWNQLLQAREAERQAELAPLREASNRALHRSGWYNVGSMMIPHDAGDVALTAAMGPGLGRLSRAGLAALGGLTTQPGDAEGAFLPREWFQRMLGSSSRVARQEGERGMQAIREARRELQQTGLPTQLSLHSDEEMNRLFPQMLDVTAPYGVIPTETRLSALMTPDRERNLEPLLSHWNDFRGTTPPVEVQRHRNNLVIDPWLEDAAPMPRLPREGQVVLQAESPYYGYFNPNDGHIGLTMDRPLDEIVGTLDHELQHWVQANSQGRYLRGANPADVRQQVPADVWDEYFQAAAGPSAPPSWTQVGGGLDPAGAERAAQHQLYRNNFGEWEARLAAEIARMQLNSPDNLSAVRGLHLGLESFLPYNSTPDFRVR